jgi:predicted DNA-binding transcriptional regulator YafY
LETQTGFQVKQMARKPKSKNKPLPSSFPKTGKTDSERRIRQADRLARTLTLVQLLMGRGRRNAKDLAQELHCSERTIHRDLQVLALAGVSWIYDDADKCYKVRPGFRFPAIRLTDDELLGQATATAISNATGLNVNSGARPTTERLRAASDEVTAKLLEDAEQVVSALSLKLADHSQSGEAIKTVQWSLIKHKQVIGQYESPYHDKQIKLTLHPYRLCLVQQAWYLIARPADELQPKTYRLARFGSLRMLDAGAVVPEAFRLKEYFGNAWAVYRGKESYDVELEFTPDAAKLVTETIWHDTQKSKLHKDGRATLTFTVDGLDEIANWITTWSGSVKVVQPEPLRKMVVQRWKEAIKLNSE